MNKGTMKIYSYNLILTSSLGVFRAITFIQVYYQYVIIIFCYKIYNHCFHLR